MREKSIKTTLRKWINSLAGCVEILISVLVLMAIVSAAFAIMTEAGFFNEQPISFTNIREFLDEALWLIIGIEFVKMLIKHTPGAAIEVLLFAIARQMIAGHPSAWETLLGVVSIAGLFAVRKYLFIHAFDEAEKYVFDSNKKLRQVNHRTMVMVPGDPDETIGELIRTGLEQENEQIRKGATLSLSNVILRVHKMLGEEITMVEVIPTGEV